MDGKTVKPHWERSPHGSWQAEGRQVIWGGEESLNSTLAILGLKMGRAEGGGDFSGSPQVQPHVK